MNVATGGSGTVLLVTPALTVSPAPATVAEVGRASLRSEGLGASQEREDPTEVEGRQALFVLNLPPRKMAGQLSEGMLFDIGYEDGITPVLATPEKPVPNGSRAG